MSLRNTVNNNVKLAFKLIGDLAIDVIFEEKPIIGFDFSNGNVSSGTLVTTTIKAVFLDEVKKSKDKMTKQLKLLCKKEDLPDPTSYDRVQVKGTWYKVGKPLEDNDYIVYLEIFSEV
jgi:hypothetical protein